jgi:hypothetical protein
MNYYINAAFSLSIGVGAVIGWLRFRRIDVAFHPFIYLSWFSFLSELTSLVLIENGYTNIVSFSIFHLGQAVLVTWQFSRWEVFENRRQLYLMLQTVWVSSWLTECIWFRALASFPSYFIILHSFVIVLLAIRLINRELLQEVGNYFQKSILVIGLGLILFFTYSQLTEIFWLLGLNYSREFRVRIYEILSYINLATNLIFALGILWMPQRPRYIMQS